MKKLKFKLNKEPFDRMEECHNHLGFDKIEILKFNYDGMENALAIFEGEMSMLEEESLYLVLHSGWYIQEKVKSKKVKLRFELQEEKPSHCEEEHNFLGFDTIEIIEFNYDSEGNALIFEDGELSYLSPDSLRFLFFSGWYKLKMKAKKNKNYEFKWN